MYSTAWKNLKASSDMCTSLPLSSVFVHLWASKVQLDFLIHCALGIRKHKYILQISIDYIDSVPGIVYREHFKEVLQAISIHFGWCSSFIQLIYSCQARQGEDVRFYAAPFSQVLLAYNGLGF